MSLISGNVTFYGNSTNDSTDPTAIVGVPLFLDNSSNQGVISSGIFSGSAFNAGEVQTTATFVGSAVNSGVVAVATFNDGAVNLGTVTSSGLFFGTAVNSGVISGNAIFANTAANNGTVEGNADFAAGASNQGGTVNGTIGVYTPPSEHPVAGTVLVTGLIITYSIGGNPVAVGTYDEIADGNGGSTNGNYNYTAAGTYQIEGSWYTLDGTGFGSYASAGTYTVASDSNKWYTFDGNGSGSYASGTFELPSDGNKWYTFDGAGGAGYASAGTYQVPSGGSWYTFDGNGSGAYASGTFQLASDNNKWYTFNGVGNGNYASAGTYQLASDNLKWYTFDGNGGGGYASGLFQLAPDATDANKWYTFDGAGGGSYVSGVIYFSSNDTWYTFDGQGGRELSNGVINESNNFIKVANGKVDGVIGAGIYFLIYYPSMPSATNKWYYFPNNSQFNNIASGTYQVASDSNKWYTFDGNGNGAYTSAGTYQLASDNLKWYTFDGNGGGGYASGILQATNGSWYTFDGNGGATPEEAPVITSHPQDVIAANLNGTFSITATGTNLQYQWEVSHDNGNSWSDLTSPNPSNTNTWIETGVPTNGQLYRCRVFNNVATVYSNSASITTGFPSAGTVLSTENTNIVINETNGSYPNGTYDVIADGNGGSTNGNYQYPSNGTVLYDDNNIYHYLANGSGGYIQYYRTGYVIQNDVANNIIINSNSYSNGTFDEVADGNNGSTFIYTYASAGTEFYAANGISYQSDGNGGYTEFDTAAAADAWGATNDGQFESSGRWYYGGAYVGGETEYNAEVDAAQAIIDADAWGVANINGQYETSGRWYFRGSYVGNESAFIAAVDGEADQLNWNGRYYTGNFEYINRWYIAGEYVGSSQEEYSAAGGL